jgi:hypothetical protein
MDGEVANPEETEEEGSERAGMKRKRTGRGDENNDVREDMARLTQENEDLRRQVDMQSGQIAELIRQLQEVQTLLGPRMPSQAPQAIM